MINNFIDIKPKESVKHLQEIVETLHPRILVIANSFTAKSIGHFNRYIYNGFKVEPREISKQFSKELSKNYIKEKIKVWNNRPNYWKLKYKGL